MAYAADLLTPPPCRTLAIKYVAAGRRPHMPFIILPIYLSSYQHHMKEYDLYLVPRSTIPKILNLTAQLPRGNPKLHQLPQSVSIHCESSALGPSYIYGSPYVHFSSHQPLCWPLGEFYIFIPCTLVSFGLPLYKSLNRNPPSTSLSASHVKNVWYSSHYVGNRCATVRHRNWVRHHHNRHTRTNY